MSWSEVVQLVILLLTSASLALFVWDQRRDRPTESPSLSQIFSNPYLRVFAIR